MKQTKLVRHKRNVQYVYDVVCAYWKIHDKNLDNLMYFFMGAPVQLQFDIREYFLNNTFIVPDETYYTRLDYKDMPIARESYQKHIDIMIQKANIDWCAKLMFEISLQQEVSDHDYKLFFKKDFPETFVEKIFRKRVQIRTWGDLFSDDGLETFNKPDIYSLNDEQNKWLVESLNAYLYWFDKAKDNKDIKRIIMERKLSK